MNDKEFIQYGKDNLTFSINLQKNKTEDWMSDWSGRVVIDGKTYFLNGYIKNESWIAGKSNLPIKNRTQIMKHKPIKIIKLILRMNHL